eukprot:GSMAST32.ASY1.ANO1.1594.1 assembled CDS
MKQKSHLWNNTNKVIIVLVADMISPFKVVEGEFRIFRECLVFHGLRALKTDTSDVAPVETKTWPVRSVKCIRNRRYLLQRTAIEIFFDDGTSIFLNLHDDTSSLKCFQIISKLKPPLMARDVEHLVSAYNWTDLWQQRKISNLEYLMHLNDAAGRTYHDLTQYPIMPWVISDYTSEDLSKPIGALNPERLSHILERFESLNDAEIPPFMYGSHYSSVGTVLYYLLRIEPYTSYGLSMQGGKFDIPDRLFYSIKNTWNNCLQSPSDVKELTPEWFSIPQFLMNSNSLQFGTRQDGLPVDDVILPPWASSAEEFIRLNRLALESDHVSSRLHHWIDLIFGYKQTGAEAVKANNLFYHLTYEGNVDFRQISDPVMRQAMETQIASFGQTPSQLFQKKHPRRINFPVAVEKSKTMSKSYVEKKNIASLSRPAVAIICGNGAFFVVDMHGDGILYRYCGNDFPVQITPASSPVTVIPHTALAQSMISGSSRPGIALLGKSRNRGRVVISSGHSDVSLCTYGAKSGNILQRVDGLHSITTAICLSELDKWVVVGSKDGTLGLWKYTKENRKTGANYPEILYGHEASISCVSINDDVGLIASGDITGVCVIHQIYPPSFLKVLTAASCNDTMTIDGSRRSYSVRALEFLSDGKLLVLRGSKLSLFSVNGYYSQAYAQIDVSEFCIPQLLISNDKRFVITSTLHKIRVLWAHTCMFSS